MRRQTTLKAKALGLLKDLSLDLEAAAGSGSVHGARRSIKRLRSLLRLVRPAIATRAFDTANGELKKAADALAGQRRAEALVTAARKLARSRAGDGLVRLAECHRDALAGAAQADGRGQARLAIGTVAGAVTSWRLPRHSAALTGASFLATYAKARKRLGHALKSRDATELHEARKQVIHHLHHLELLHDVLPGSPPGRVAELEALREVLGDLNDLDELKQLAESQPQPPGGRGASILQARRKSLLARARKAAKPLFKHRPHAFAKRIGAMWPGKPV